MHVMLCLVVFGQGYTRFLKGGYKITMKKWIYLLIGVALLLNMVASIIGVVVGYLSYAVGIVQSLWGLLGIYLVLKAKRLFKLRGSKNSE